MRQRVFTFIIIFSTWIILTGRITVDVVIIGTVVALLTAVLFSDMLFRLSNQNRSLLIIFRNILLLVLFIPFFFYEALISALKVSRHVFEKEPSFSPGIVKVKTHLTNVSVITLLANLITLTPGTLTLDFDKSERAYYIHWIDVKSREEAVARKEIIEKFERWLGVIFQ